MKKLILTFGIFLAGVVFVNAQITAPPNAANSPSQKMITHLTQVCSLTPDQTVKIKPIADAVVKAHQENKQKYANNPEGLKNANKSVNESFKTQLKAILTPDQMAKFTADMAQRKNEQTGTSTSPRSEE